MTTSGLEIDISGPGLTLITGPNGSGKSRAARELVECTPGAELLSAESQQAFYEAELAADDSNFQEATDYGTPVAELLGEAARQHPLLAAFRLESVWDRGYRVLSTGEARKVLLLQAVLRAPSLLILDDPFDGLDRASCAELANAIVQTSQRLPVVVVGSFSDGSLPFPREALKEVRVLGRPRATAPSKPPPVDLGNWYEPIPAGVPLVDLVGGRVCYGEQVVFDGLDFRVEVGQHTLIEGPNGSGKSTLLDMLTGDHPQAYSNDLRLFGRQRGTGETVWDIKKNIGAVSSRLHRDYRVGGSVEEVLLSGLYDSIGIYQRPEPSHRTRARTWLEWLELGLAPETPFRDLSFGQQRLLLIARAAIKVPPLVVLDEATSGLDPENRARALELAASLCSQRKSTVLMVTHRADEHAFWQSRIGGAILTLPIPR